MKKLLLFLSLLFPTIALAEPPDSRLAILYHDFGLAYPQGQNFGNNVIHGTGAPSGACAAGTLYTNDSNGNLYACNSTVWILAGGGSTIAIPVTVTGGVSGGIPYFNSTTQMSASAILNTNILIKGGGAGAAPTNSSCTDNATTVSCTEGINSSVSISAGTAPTVCGSATGCIGLTEAATACTSTASQDCIRASTSHGLVYSVNNSAEFPVPLFSATPAGSKCVNSSGTIGLISEATLACGQLAYPITITGGVSGGIPCFTGTTTEAASVLLGAGVIPKGGGAGACVAASSMTDNGTNVTSTDTGGYIAPVFVSNGSTAGFVDYPQGTTSAAVGPCNTATSICEQAPTAVTSYLLNKLSAPASGIKLESNSASVLTESISGDSNHSIHVTAQTATKTIYTLCTASAGGCNVAGQYRVTWYFNQGGTACGTPTPGQVTFALSWTDNAGAHSAIALPMNDNSSIAVFTSAFKFASSNTTGFASGEFNLWSTGAQPIQVTNTYTACGVGTGTWELTAAVEQVQ